MDFRCFYFPLFCIHWLMGDHLLSTDIVGNADYFRTYPMGLFYFAQMGKFMGEVDYALSDSSLLWGNALLRNITIFYN